jgi:hypothetical protein
LVTVQPAQGAQRVDTKAQIALFFNQSIDASQLEVTVFETAFGKTWLNQDAQGTEFFNAKGHQLVDVQRDHQAVPLSLQLIGNNKTVLVNLGREPAYNATVFVEVTYQGNSYARYQYQTAALPTLINLVVRDQYNRAVPNIRVEETDRDKAKVIQPPGGDRHGQLGLTIGGVGLLGVDPEAIVAASAPGSQTVRVV